MPHQSDSTEEEPGYLGSIEWKGWKVDLVQVDEDDDDWEDLDDDWGTRIQEEGWDEYEDEEELPDDHPGFDVDFLW